MARYLGNLREAEGISRPNTDKRYNAMREGYYIFEGLWRCSEVPRTLKITMYKNLVFNTGTSGLEAEIQTKEDIRRLETLNVTLMRKVICGEAAIVKENGERWQLTNTEIRIKMKVATITSELRHRRVFKGLRSRQRKWRG